MKTKFFNEEHEAREYAINFLDHSFGGAEIYKSNNGHWYIVQCTKNRVIYVLTLSGQMVLIHQADFKQS